MWLLYKGKDNKIWVLSKRYMKHTLNDKNEPFAFTKIMFGTYLLEKLQRHETSSWDSFLTQLMIMKLVQFVFLIVAVVETMVVATVPACKMVRVQTSCGL